ncbi:MAG: hypothetical protein HZR80_10730 [Candidatus Heimdallarchaeota archaeon]
MKNIKKFSYFYVGAIILGLVFFAGNLQPLNNYAFSENILTEGLFISPESTHGLQFTDFRAFRLYDDSPHVDSFNTSDEIYFFYNEGSSECESENYVLTWDDYGNCTDFEIFASFNYTMLSIDDLLSFKLITSSYYDYLGNYIGDTIPSESQYLNFAGIWDGWTGSGGKHVAVAYPNGIKERYETNYGVIGYSGDLTEHLIRNSSGLYSELYDTNTGDLIIGHYWNTGVDKHVNYLSINFASGETVSEATACIYDIFATLWIDGMIDDNAPSLTITDPTNGTTIESKNVTISWEGSDQDSEINHYEIKIDVEDWIKVGLDTEYTINNIDEGIHEVEVKVIDLFQTFRIESVIFTIVHPEDTIPTLSIPGFTIFITLLPIVLIPLLHNFKKKKA